MADNEESERLRITLHHLHAFAFPFNAKDLMNTDNKLSATDLNAILYA